MDEITEDDLRQLFMRLDNGNKGYLDEADLASLVTTSDQLQQDTAITQLMDQLDADKDGRVSFNDFCLGYGTGMTTNEAHGNADEAEVDSGVPLNNINVISDEIFVPDEMNVDSPNATQTQRVVFRHKRFGRRSVPSNNSDVIEESQETNHLLKPADEQNADIQILSPLTMSPPDSRPGSSQEHYPDLASQMESFYQAPVHYDGSRRNSRVLNWIDSKDTLFEDTGTEHGSASLPRINSPKSIPAVVEAIEKRNYSVEITKADISVMCQYSGGEEETEELMELFDKLDERNNGQIKLETFIAGVHFQQKHMANVTSTPPPAVGWTPKMPALDQSFGTPLPAKSMRGYVSSSTPRQTVTPLPATGAEVPLGHVPLTSLGSGTSNYVTADELASTWHKLGIDATNDEVENFIEKLPADQSGYISIPDLSASIESALVMDEADRGSKKIALLSIKQEISSLRSQVIHLSMERDKLKVDASHAMETSRRIVKEGDDIALEIHNRWEAEKREIEEKYENKLKEQNRSWSKEIQRMSEAYNEKAVELELLEKKHQDEVEVIKSDLQDAKFAKEQFEKAFEKVKFELAEEQRAHKALQRDLSCHPESIDYDDIESLKERIRELESGSIDDEARQLQEQNKELVDKLDVLQHENERLRQRYFHERRKSQRQRSNQDASGRKSSNSRKISKQDLPKSDDTTQPSVNSALSEDEEDFRSESATLLEEITEEEQQTTLANRVAELIEKTSDLEAQLSDFKSNNVKLASTVKVLEKKLSDSVEKEKITSQRLGQDLTKERQNSHLMSMKADVLNKENMKLQNEMAEVTKHNTQLEDRLTRLNNAIKLQQLESDNKIHSLTGQHRAEMNELQEAFNQEREQLNDNVMELKKSLESVRQELEDKTATLNDVAELKKSLELMQQELEDKTATLNNAMEVMRAENEEKDIRLSDEKELHESVIEQLQTNHEKELERLTADLEDAQRAQLKYLEEAKEKEVAIEQMQAQIAEAEATHLKQLTDLRQQLEETDKGTGEQIQELHKQVSLSQEKNVQLKQKITQLESETTALKGALKQAKEKNTVIKKESSAEIEKLKDKLFATVKAVENDQKAIENLTDDLNERERKIEELEGEKKLIIAEQNATIKKGKQNAEAVKVLKDQYKLIIDGLKDEIKELKETKQKLKESNEKDKMAFQNKEKELESKIQELEKSQNEKEQKYLDEKQRFEEEIRNYVATKVELERDLHSNELEMQEMQEAHKQGIDTLQKKMSNLESNLQTATTTHDEQVKCLNAHLRDFGERENALKTRCKEYQEEITHLSKSLDEQKAAIEELTEKLEVTKTSHDEEMARSKEKIGKIQSALDDATDHYLTEKESLTEQLTALQESSESHQHKVEQLQKECDESKASLTTKDGQIKKMMDEAKKAQEEKLQLEARIRQKEQQLQGKQTESTALQEQLSLEAQKLKEANNHYEKEKASFDNQVTSLEERLNEQTENVKKLTTQMQELKNNHATAVQQIDVRASNPLLEKKQLQEASDQCQVDLQTLQEENHALKQKLAESQARERTILNQSEAQMNTVREEKAVLEANLKETETQYSEKVAQLDGQLEKMRLEKEHLETTSSQMNQQFNENEMLYANEISEMREKINKMTAEHQETVSSHSTENSLLQKKIVSLQNDAQASNETIDKLKHQLQELNAAKEAIENKVAKEKSITLELQSKIDTLNLQLQQSADTHDELNSKHRASEVKINELASTNADTQTNYNMTIKQVRLARQCVTQFKSKFESELTETLLQCHNKLVSLKDQIALSVRNVSGLQNRIVQQQTIIAEYKQTISTQKIDHDNAHQQNKEKISNLQQQLQHSEEKIVTLEKQIKELNELVPKMENDFSTKLETLQQECDKHAEKIQWLETENRNLIEQSKQQSGDYNQLLETKDTLLDEQEQQFLNKFEVLKGKLSRAEDALSTKQFEIDELQQSLQNISTQAAVMEEKLSSQEKVQDKPDASEEAIIKVKLANLVQQLKSKLDKFDEQKMSSRTQINLLEATAQKKEIFIETAADAIEVSLQRLDEIQQHYTEEMKLSKKECEQLKNELDDLSNRYQELDDQLQKTQQHYAIEIEGLRQQFAVKEKLYTTSSEEKEQLEKEREQLKNELDDLVIRYQQLDEQLQKTQQHHVVEIDGLRQQFAVKEKLYTTSSEEKEQLEKEHEQLKNELDDLVIRYQQLDEQLQKTQQHHVVEIDGLWQQFAVKENLYTTSSEEKEQLEKEHEQLKNELDDLVIRYQQLDKQLQKTQQHHVVEIDGLQQQFAVKEKLYTASSEEKDQLEKDYEKLKAERDSLVTKYEELKTQLQKAQQHHSVEIDTLQQQFATKEKLDETTTKETQNIINNLKQQEEKLFTKIEVLTTELDTCKTTFTEKEMLLNDNINQLEADLQKSEEDRISQEQSNNDMIQQFKEELVKLQTLLQEEQRASSTAQTQLDESFTTFSHEKTALESSIDTLNKQLTTSNEEVVHLRRKSLSTETALKQLEVDYKRAKEEHKQSEEQCRTEINECTQRYETLQQVNEQLSEEISALNKQMQDLQVQHETQVEELTVKLKTQTTTADQVIKALKAEHHRELANLQSSISDQMRSLQQLRELVDSTHRTAADNNSIDLTKEISTLKALCDQRPSTLDQLVSQRDMDMDMIEQEHEEEVKALRQEKYVLQQKLQEAEVKWNHFIAEQGSQIKKMAEQTSNNDQLLQTLFVENQQLEQAKVVMSITISELNQEKQAYMKIIKQLAHLSCQLPITSISR